MLLSLKSSHPPSSAQSLSLEEILNRMGFKAVFQRFSTETGSMTDVNVQGAPCDEESSHHPGDRPSSGSPRNIFKTASFALACVKRFAKNSKAALGCLFSVETLGSEEMSQPEYAEVDPKPSSEESLRSVNPGDADTGVNESVLYEDSKRDSPNEPGIDKKKLVTRLMSEEGSDELAEWDEQDQYRFYHQLPNEEKQPTFEEGMVRRLAALLLPHFTGGLSNEYYLRTISEGKQSGSGEDAEICQQSVEESQTKSPQGACKNLDDPRLQSQPEVAPEHQHVKIAEKSESDPSESATLTGVDFITTNGFKAEELEDKVAFTQVSFRDDEDCCTPIQEFEISHFGCVLQ